VIRVTVEDTETGKTETQEVEANDYFILTTGACHVEHTQVYPTKGTHVLTIKGRRDAVVAA
jgi:hypothetical protein